MLLQPYVKNFVKTNICWVIVGIYYNKIYQKYISPVFQKNFTLSKSIYTITLIIIEFIIKTRSNPYIATLK